MTMNASILKRYTGNETKDASLTPGQLLEFRSRDAELKVRIVHTYPLKKTE